MGRTYHCGSTERSIVRKRNNVFKSLKILLLMYCFWTIFLLASQAEERAKQAPPQVLISLDQCIVRALQANYDVQLSKLDQSVADASIMIANGTFDPSIGADVSYSGMERKLRAEDSIIYGGINSFESRTLTASTSLSQTLSTGTGYSIDYSVNRDTGTFVTTFGDDTDGDGYPDSQRTAEYNSNLTLSLTQPLLQNFGITINLGARHQAELDAQAAQLSVEQQIIDLISSIKKAYWELLLARKNLQVQQKAMKTAEDFLEMNKTKVNLGIVPPIEIVIAQSEVASRRQAIIDAKNAVENSEDALLALMNANETDPLWNSSVIPITETKVEPIPQNLGKALLTAYEKRVEMLQAKLYINKAEIGVKLAQNSVLPSLDATASYTMGDVENNYSDSVQGMIDRNSYTVYGGLSFEIPWHRHYSKASLLQAQAELKKKKINLEQLKVQIRLEVRKAYRELLRSKEQIDASRIARELAQQKLEAENKKYELGSSTMYNVIQFQKDLVEAESNELAAIITFQKATVDWYHTLGITLEKNNVSLQQAMKMNEQTKSKN